MRCVCGVCVVCVCVRCVCVYVCVCVLRRSVGRELSSCTDCECVSVAVGRTRMNST